MTAIISNNTLGLMSSSLDPSRAMNVGGFGAPGQSGEALYVNVATGNLVVQRQDEMLKARGLDVESLLTYNSQGVLDGDNNDNWRIGFYRQIKSFAGTINNVGSTVVRVDADGAERTYSYATASNAYVSTDGDGSHDTLQYNISAALWTWTDGDSRVTETYGWSNGIGKLLSRSDTAGNSTTYTYDIFTGLLSRVVSASGESTFLDYSGLNLTRLRTVRSDGTTSTRVLYAYDGTNRLTRVTVDLSPDDNSVADNNTYVSNYTYDGTSRRIATLTQSDGTSLSFTYDTSGRVSSITDALGRQCLYAYDSANRITTVTDALGLQSTWRYDAKGQLLQATSPNGTGGTASRSYAYSSNGDLVQVTDELGRSTVMQYDANGNQTLQRDSLGNTVTRTFNGKNQLLSETTYLVPDPDGLDDTHANSLGAPGTPLTTRYVYDAAGKSQLRFIISPEGRVTEYRYNSNGQRIAAIDYASTQYTATSALESDLSAWAAGTAVDRTRSVRTDYAWDFRGQLSSSTVWGSVDSAGNGVAGTTTLWGTVGGTGATTTYLYDARGLLLSTIAPLGGAAQTTSYVYDGLGRTIRVTNGLGQLTSTSYDDAGNKVIVTAANGLVTTSTRDALGRLVSIQDMYQSSSTPTGPIYSTERYFYDKGDRLRMIEDATGVRTWLLYDDANRKVGEIDGNGSLTEFIYNAAGQLTRTIRYATAASTTGLTVDTNGSPSAAALALTLSALRPAANASQDQSTWNAYDSAGRLVETVDAAGGVTETRYDGASRVVGVIAYANRISTNALGNQPTAASIAPGANASADQVTRNFYDNDGLLQGTLDAEGYLVEIMYDAAGRETQRIAYATATSSSLRAAGTLTQLRPATNANDISSWRFYDDRNQLVAEIDGERYLTENLYDANGNQRQSIRYANRVTATISAGATLATLRPATNAADQTSTWTYDALNRVASETDFEGTQTTYGYDSAGNLTQVVKAASTSEARTSTTTYNQAGQISAEINGRNKTTSYALDLAGRRISETDANGNRTLYYYDADDQLVYSINALGEVSANVYNTLHQRTAEIRYGSSLGASTLATMTGGLVTSSVQNTLNALANATLDSRTSYTYNLDGTLASSMDALNKTASYQYDVFGNRTKVTTPISSSASLEETYAYDRRNLQTSMREDPTVLNVTTSVQYDAFGRVISQTDARGKVSQQTYDKLGRVVQTRDRLNQTQSITYDAFDRVLTQTDSLGSVTSYSYSATTRSVSIRTPEGITVTTARNRLGETQTVTDGRGNVTTYVYDANGNLTQTTSPAGQVTKQRYDDADRLIETTDANNIKTAISYDAANRVLSRTVDPNATGYTGRNLLTSYAWDAKGQQIRVTDPLGSTTDIAYDLNGQVIRRTVDTGAGRLNLKTLYSYDDRGQTLTVTDHAGGVTQYGYDKLGRRIEERIDPTGLNLTTRYEYDGNDNVVAKIDANNNRTRYAYDDEDRLRFEVDALGQVKETRYDAEGRVSRTIGYANPISLVGLGTAVSVADVTARLVSDLSRDSIESKEYDRDGRLTYAVDGVGAVTKYDYDGNGNVVQQTRYANQIAPGSAAYVPYVANTNSALWRDLGAFQLGDRVTATVYFKADSPITGRLYIGDGTSNAGVSVFSGIVTGNGAWQQLTVTLTLTKATNLRIYIYGNRDGTSHPASGDFVLYDKATVSSTGRGQVLDENFHSLTGWNDQAAGKTGLRSVAALDLATASSLLIADPVRDQITRNVYDAANRLVYAVDGTGAVTKYDYDALGNVIQKTAYGTRITAVAPASSVAANASIDQVSRNVYDAANRLVYAVDGTGAVTKYDYDANGNVVQKTAYATRIAAGALASSVAANASIDQVSRNVYDAANRLVYAVDGTGALTKYDYDANGNVVQQTRYANPIPTGSAAYVPYVANTNSALWRDLGAFQLGDRVTATVYFKADSPITGRLYIGDGTSNAGVSVFSGIVTGNGAWQKLTVTLTLTKATNLRIYIYGNRDGTSHPASGDFVLYDKATVSSTGRGQVLDENFHSLTGWNDQAAGKTRLRSVAALDLATASSLLIVDPVRDQITRNVYDAADRLVYAVDGTGAVTKYDYDATGNVIQQTAYANPVVSGKALRVPYVAGTNSAWWRDLGTFRAGDKVTLSVYFKSSGSSAALLYLGDGGTGMTSSITAGNGNWQKLSITYTVPADMGLRAYLYCRSTGTSVAGDNVLYDNMTVTSMQRGMVTNEPFSVFGFDYDETGGNLQLVDVPALSVANAAGMIVADTSRDQVTRNVYDAADRLVYAMDGTGAVTKYDYDATGNVIQQTAYANPVVSGKALRVPYVAGTNSAWWRDLGTFRAGDKVTLSVYFKSSGNSAALIYLGDGGPGLTSSVTPGNGNWQKLSITYDLTVDMPLKVYLYCRSLVPNTNVAGDNVLYDNMTVTSMQRGMVTNEPFSVFGFDYDETGGNLQLVDVPALSVANAAGMIVADTSRDRITRHAYDAAGRRIQTTLPTAGVYAAESDAALMANGAAGLASRTETSQALSSQTYYDAQGNVIASRDVAGNLRYRAYDAIGQTRFDVDAEGYVTGYQYDAFGNVASLTRYADKIADATRSAWGVQGASLATITSLVTSNAANRTITTLYDQAGRAIEVREPSVMAYDGSTSGQAMPVTRHVYDAFGQRVQSQRQKLDGSWLNSYAYFDQSGREVATVDAGSYLTRRSYDAFGNVIEVVEYAGTASAPGISGYGLPASQPEDRRVLFTYDSENRKISDTRVNVTYSVASDGSELTGNLTNLYAYDSFGNQVMMRDAGGYASYQYYDAANQLRAVTSSSRTIAGNANFIGLTEFIRDTFGNVTNQIERVNGASSANATGYSNDASGSDRINSMVWNSRNQIVETVDADSKRQYFSYDAQGNVAKQWSSLAVSTGVERTVFKVSTYDRVGRLVSTVEPASSSGATSSLVRNQMRYNAFGEMVSKGIAGMDDGWSEYFSYDNSGRLVGTNSGDGVNKVMGYDLQGNLVSNFRGAAGTQRTDYAYDALGRLTRETGTARLVNGSLQRPVINRTYDRWGNLTSVNDPASTSAVTNMRYNANNQLVKETRPTFWGYRNDGVYGDVTPVSNFYYDYAGSQLASRDARGNVNGSTYDSVGNVLTEIHADGGIIRHVYNAFSEEVQRTDAMGNVTNYEYDRLGRMTRLIRPDADFYSIDNQGFFQSLIQGLTPPVRGYSDYDYQGIRSRYYAGRYRAAELGDALRLTYSVKVTPGYKVTFYDDDPNINSSVHETSGALASGVAGDVAVIEVKSTNTINPISLDANRSSSIQKSYNQAGKQLSVTNAAGQRLDYSYDLRGNITRVTQPDGQAIISEFNAQDRKVREVTGFDTATWSYDYFGRLMSRTDISGAVHSYTYDNVSGNLVVETSTPLEATGNLGRNVSYSYDGAGQLVWMREAGSFFADTYRSGDRITRFSYDLAGRRISEETSITNGSSILIQSQNIIYDISGRLVKVLSLGVQSANSRELNYVYDAVGNRVRQDENIGGDSMFSYFAYDAMNRQILVDGAYDNNPYKTNTSQYRPDKTVRIDYDKNGNRIAETRWDKSFNSFQTTNFTYDALGRLTVDGRGYDRADRLVKMTVGMGETEVRCYNAKGQLTGQAVILDQDYGYGVKSATINDYVGDNLAVSISFATNYGSTTFYTYKKIGDSYKQTYAQTDNPVANTTATTTLAYDVNGNVSSLGRNNAIVAYFANDASGRILTKFSPAEGGSYRLHNLIVNGHVLGTHGAERENGQLVERRDFIAYQPIEKTFAGGGQSGFRVNAGDTLRSIAYSAYGDAEMWYVIADANGVGGQSLQVGQVLILPQQVGTIRNNVNTFEPYNAARIIGNTSPVASNALAVPVDQCYQTGIIIGAVVAALVITVITAGVGSAVGAALIGAGMGTAATIAATVTAGVVIGAAGGALASAASQGILMAGGLQRKFDWADVATGALIGGIAGGISAVGGLAKAGMLVGRAGKLGKIITRIASASYKSIRAADSGAKLSEKGIFAAKVALQIGRSASEEAMSQGIAIAAGKQAAFDWSKVAIGAAGGVLDAVPLSDVIENAALKAQSKVLLGMTLGAVTEAAKNSVTQGLEIAYAKGNGKDLSFNLSRFVGAASSGVFNGGASQWLKLDSVKKNLLFSGAIGLGAGLLSDAVAQGSRIGLTGSKTYDGVSTIVGGLSGGLKAAGKVIGKRAEDSWKNKPVMIALRMTSFASGAIADIFGDYQKVSAKGNGRLTVADYGASLQKTVRGLSKKAAEEVGGSFGTIGGNKLEEMKKEIKAIEEEFKASQPDSQYGYYSNGVSITRTAEPGMKELLF